eukprot:scaffold111811_cov26-Tisochrysis_lutea.AAC.1
MDAHFAGLPTESGTRWVARLVLDKGMLKRYLRPRSAGGAPRGAAADGRVGARGRERGHGRRVVAACALPRRGGHGRARRLRAGGGARAQPGTPRGADDARARAAR